MCKEADEPDTYYRNLHSLAWKSISRALPDDKDLARRVADSIDVLSCWTRDEGDPVVWQPPHRSSKTISLTSQALRSTTQTSIRAYTPCTPRHGLICTLSTTHVLARISSNAPTRGDILTVHEILFVLNTDLSKRVSFKLTAEDCLEIEAVLDQSNGRKLIVSVGDCGAEYR